MTLDDCKLVPLFSEAVLYFVLQTAPVIWVKGMRSLYVQYMKKALVQYILIMLILLAPQICIDQLHNSVLNVMPPVCLLMGEWEETSPPPPKPLVASQGFRCQGTHVLLYKEDMNQKGETKGGDPQVLYSKERASM